MVDMLKFTNNKYIGLLEYHERMKKLLILLLDHFVPFIKLTNAGSQ
jgi:hypothetical protein